MKRLQITYKYTYIMYNISRQNEKPATKIVIYNLPKNQFSNLLNCFFLYL